MSRIKVFIGFATLIFAGNCAANIDIGDGDPVTENSPIEGDNNDGDGPDSEDEEPEIVQESKVFEISPSEIDSGDVSVGSKSEIYTVTVSANEDSEELAIDPQAGIVVVSSDCEGSKLNAGESCMVELQIEPTEEMFTGGAVEISDGNETAIVSVNGSDTSNTGNLTLSPSSVSFGSVYKHMTRYRTLTVTNDSSAAAGPVGVSLNQRPFDIHSNGCLGSTLAPSESCSIQVKYQPFGDSNDSATLRVSAGTLGDSATISGMGQEDD